MAVGQRFLHSTISLLFRVLMLCLYKVSFTSDSQINMGLDCRIASDRYLQSLKQNNFVLTQTI